MTGAIVSAVVSSLDARTGIIAGKDGVEGAVFKKVCDIASGFYVDSAFTGDKIGAGIAKNITDNISLGGYAMTNYGDLFGFKPSFTPALGLSIKF